MPINPSRLNHAVFFVSDLDRAVDFYTNVMGMEVLPSGDIPGAAFLRLPDGQNHHDLGLFSLGPNAIPKQQGQVGLYHLAWQVDTIEELAAARPLLMEAGAFTGESSHGATKSLYGRDPDGNEFEIMWMLPREEWGQWDNQAVVEPLRLDEEVARWGGVATR